MPLNANTFYEIFRFFNRRELFLLSMIYHRFDRIIENAFPTTPLVLLDYVLFYGCGDYALAIQGTDGDVTALPDEFINQLPGLKFIRFKQIMLRENDSSNPMEKVILPMSHIWEGRDLIVQYPESTPSVEFSGHLVTAFSLHLECVFDNNMNIMLRELLKGKCEHFMVKQKGWNAHFAGLQLNIPEFTNFLFFRASSDFQPRFIHLHTYTDPTIDSRNKLFAAVEERFSKETKLRLSFVFEWNATPGALELLRQARNDHINQTLILYKSSEFGSRGFSFATSSRD
ncbi:hypothetical protein DdX_12422 [Ditylenchus destructor]|uniref:F-box domain-containing protein n=1 Tax=Ditylenchus destructor TaxID=166010 RepID=A0AAD4MWL2_9BILA|nr:hypothetical protein DdX_12422 [Ditylenchus destructor]